MVVTHVRFLTLVSSRRYWTLSEAQPDAWQPLAAPLPSDCRYRRDLVAVRAGGLKEAQVMGWFWSGLEGPVVGEGGNRVWLVEGWPGEGLEGWWRAQRRPGH
jgi:hypothetical protein